MASTMATGKLSVQLALLDDRELSKMHGELDRRVRNQEKPVFFGFYIGEEELQIIKDELTRRTLEKLKRSVNPPPPEESTFSATASMTIPPMTMTMTE